MMNTPENFLENIWAKGRSKRRGSLSFDISSLTMEETFGGGPS